MEWGEQGAAAIAPGADFAVIVDVLRFTTALSVAVERGIEVYPHPWRDDLVGPVGLSPKRIRAATGLTSLVLPSPNGSALAVQLAATGATVVGACLRNRAAVARRLASARPSAIAVVAAGERWPDGSLRPAIEDLWGAGSVVAALAAAGVSGLSQEALAAAAAFGAVEEDLHTALLACASGVELSVKGYGDDVAIAAELDSSACVPVMSGGRFIDALAC